MRYMVRVSIVHVVGPIWQPGITAAQTYSLNDYDVRNATDEDGKITRESVAAWLDMHAGDFSGIDDFSASIEPPDGGDTVELPWADETSELTFSDAMYGEGE